MIRVFPVCLFLFFGCFFGCGSVAGEKTDTSSADVQLSDLVADVDTSDVEVSPDSAIVDSGTADAETTPDQQGVSDTDDSDEGASDLGSSVEDAGFSCPGDTPVECSNIRENGQSTCYPENTDCDTLQVDASGALVWCEVGDDVHINDDGFLQCCGGEKPMWCEPTEAVPGYPGWCHPEGTDCETLKQCGSGVPEACKAGFDSFCRGDGKVSCCGGDTSFWCPPFGGSVGFCRPENAGCNQAVTCDNGETWGVCSFGVSTECSSDGLLFCCTDETPQWCAPGSGANPDFPGRCFSESTNCELVGPGPDNTWVSCEASESASIDVYGNLICCGGETPVHCDNYAGLDATYDGSQCFPVGTDCDSLTKNTVTGLWDSCTIGQGYGITSGGNLLCCGESSPVYCSAGLSVADGDSALNFSVSEVSPVLNTVCEGACTLDADCFGSVPPLKCKPTGGESFVDSNESGAYEEGEEFTDLNGNGIYDAQGCNQCVANNASFSLEYSGGCWEAGTDCTRLHFCGGGFKLCPTATCYCWNGILIENW